jgi:phenylacetate-CoA ligase
MKKALSRKNLWEKTLPLLKSTLGPGIGIIPAQWLLGKSFRENCKFVQDAQWWSVERSREHQIERLRQVTKLAYEKTSFYRHLFDSVGFRPGDLRSMEDMNRLPTINKQTVIENISRMCTKSVNSGDVDFGSTGGTSGTPLYFYLDANRSSVEYAYLTASWERADYRLGMSMAVLRGRTVPSDRNGFRHEYDPILRYHYYSSFHLSDENMGRYLDHIAGVGPCFLHVYPSTITALARFIVRSHRDPPENIRGIIAESEIVYPEQRKSVEEVFGRRYFSCYGHSEKLVLAAECEHSSNYHVWPTYGYFELLDEEGNPVTTPDQRGEIVGTGFINMVMPFIRYRTGDWATYVGDHCELCKREHPIICDIRGHRTQEILIATDDSEIPWTGLNMHDDTFLHIRQFQFIQESPGQAALHIVPADGFKKEDISRIHRNLARKLSGRLSFTVEIVDSIPLSIRGKAIYVDQRIQQKNTIPSDPERNV